MVPLENGALRGVEARQVRRTDGLEAVVGAPVVDVVCEGCDEKLGSTSARGSTARHQGGREKRESEKREGGESARKRGGGRD